MRRIGLSCHDHEGHEVPLCGVCKMSPGILGIPAQKPEHQITDGILSLNLGVSVLLGALSLMPWRGQEMKSTLSHYDGAVEGRRRGMAF